MLNRTTLFLVAWGLFGAARVAAAEERETRNAKILLTTLSFDRALSKRANRGDIVIATAGACATAAMIQRAEGKKIRELTIRVKPFPDGVATADSLRDAGVAALFYCSQASEPAELAKHCIDAGVLAMTDDSELAKTSAAVGLESGEKRSQLVINASLARKQGADFDPRLFGAARVIE